jgi:hypothetical protein
MKCQLTVLICSSIGRLQTMLYLRLAIEFYQNGKIILFEKLSSLQAKEAVLQVTITFCHLVSQKS